MFQACVVVSEIAYSKHLGLRTRDRIQYHRTRVSGHALFIPEVLQLLRGTAGSK
jgi:hypothetical protein